MSSVHRISGISHTHHEEAHRQSSAAPPFVPRPARQNAGVAARGDTRGSVADGGLSRRLKKPAENASGGKGDENAEEGGLSGLPCYLTLRQGQQQDDADDGDELSQLEEVAGSRESMLELDNLADELAPLADQSGIFEVMLPDGERLGVVINQSARETGILLTPSSRKLGERLKSKRTELERRLARHIGRDISLAVL